MAAKNMGDAEFIWRKEEGDNWGCLNKLSDWEQKLYEPEHARGGTDLRRKIFR
jgi:hypothetical protein